MFDDYSDYEIDELELPSSDNTQWLRWVLIRIVLHILFIIMMIIICIGLR